MKRVDFYFDFISPYTYLAATQLECFSEAYEIDFHWVPVNLPGLIKLSGNTPPGMIKNKALYSLRDLKRWADYLQVPFKMIRPGTFDSRPALYIANALDERDRQQFSLGLFEALWSGEVDPREDRWLDKAFTLKCFPADWRDQSIDSLDENTLLALKAGAFGVPTFVLHRDHRPEMFFGMDHMDFLARASQIE